jgi:hypothetical protein
MMSSLSAVRLGITTMRARRLLGAALLATAVMGAGGAEAAPAPPPIDQHTVAVSCSPRPRVGVRSEIALLPEMIGLPGQDALHVTVTTSGVGNGVRALRFTTTSNALVSVFEAGAYAAPYAATYASGAEPSRVTFLLWRPNLQLSAFARMVVVDACGEWTTFVGRGASR